MQQKHTMRLGNWNSMTAVFCSDCNDLFNVPQGSDEARCPKCSRFFRLVVYPYCPECGATLSIDGSPVNTISGDSFKVNNKHVDDGIMPVFKCNYCEKQIPIARMEPANVAREREDFVKKVFSISPEAAGIHSKWTAPVAEMASRAGMHYEDIFHKIMECPDYIMELLPARDDRAVIFFKFKESAALRSMWLSIIDDDGNPDEELLDRLLAVPVSIPPPSQISTKIVRQDVAMEKMRGLAEEIKSAMKKTVESFRIECEKEIRSGKAKIDNTQDLIKAILDMFIERFTSDVLSHQ